MTERQTTNDDYSDVSHNLTCSTCGKPLPEYYKFAEAVLRVQAELQPGVELQIGDDGLTLIMGGNRYAVDGEALITSDKNKRIFDFIQSANWLESMRLVDA